MIDKLLDEINEKSNQLINDVQKRTQLIIENTVDLSINKGKQQINELKKSLKLELTNIEERIELIKKNSTADFEQNVNNISSRILSEKEKLETSVNDTRCKLFNVIKLLEHDVIETIENKRIQMESIFDEYKDELEDNKQKFLDEMEQSFINKLEFMISDNKTLIFKIILKSIFNFKKAKE